jgi:PKD domain
MQRIRQIRLLVAMLAISVGLGFVITPAGHAAAAGCGVGNPCLRLHLPGGGTVVVSGAEIAAQATVHSGCVQYPERITAGGTVVDGPCVLTSLTVHDLLADVLPSLTPPIAPESIETTKLIRPFNGTGSFLTGGDLAEPSDFADPTLLPAFYLTGNAGSLIQYVRPLKASTADVNATDDVIQTPNDGSPLDLYLYTGRLLSATATRSRQSIDVGQSVTFTGRSVGATSYHWDFGDGTTGVGREVTHVFRAAGRPQILLTVGGADGATGEANPVSVTVNGTTSAPSVSPSPGGAGGRQSSSPRPQQSGGGGSSASRVASAKSAGGGSGTSAPPTPTPASATPQPSRTASVPPAEASLPVVRGRVIGAGKAVLLRPAASTADAAKAGVPAGGTSSAGRALAGGGAGVALMLLLGAGAASERRWARSRRRTMGRS